MKKTETFSEDVSTSARLMFTSALQRSLVGVIEYPLECIKTRWQANPQLKTMREVVTYSYKLYGLRGFYDGFIPNLPKRLPIQLFRWPMILELPSYYRKRLTDNHQDYRMDIVANLLAALTIASIETPLAAPFDTCRLDMIINRKNKNSLLNYLREQKQFRQHFKGIHVLYIKEIFGWGSFLIPFNIGREYSKNKQKSLNPIHILSISALCGIANAIAVTPWDIIRNYFQKNKNTPHLSLKESACQIYSKYGLKSFLVGSPIRFFQIAMGTALSIPIIAAYETKTQELSR